MEASSQNTSDMNGSPMSEARMPGMVVQIRPPASDLILRMMDGVTNWEATVKSVSFSLSSKS